MILICSSLISLLLPQRQFLCLPGGGVGWGGAVYVILCTRTYLCSFFILKQHLVYKKDWCLFSSQICFVRLYLVSVGFCGDLRTSVLRSADVCCLAHHSHLIQSSELVRDAPVGEDRGLTHLSVLPAPGHKNGRGSSQLPTLATFRDIRDDRGIRYTPYLKSKNYPTPLWIPSFPEKQSCDCNLSLFELVGGQEGGQYDIHQLLPHSIIISIVVGYYWSLGCSESHYLDQSVFKGTEICLPLPPPPEY